MDISAQLVRKTVTLEKRVHPTTPAITADKKRLTQIMYNLIGNALKFTHKGSVTVEVKPDAQLTQASTLPPPLPKGALGSIWYDSS